MILAGSAQFRVRLGILAQVGALWALARRNEGGDASDIRYREVARMLEQTAEEARAAAAAGGGGGGHGGGDGWLSSAPCEVGEHPLLFPLHKVLNDEFCSKNDEFEFKTMNFALKTMNFLPPPQAQTVDAGISFIYN